MAKFAHVLEAEKRAHPWLTKGSNQGPEKDQKFKFCFYLGFLGET